MPFESSIFRWFSLETVDFLKRSKILLSGEERYLAFVQSVPWSQIEDLVIWSGFVSTLAIFSISLSMYLKQEEFNFYK